MASAPATISTERGRRRALRADGGFQADISWPGCPDTHLAAHGSAGRSPRAGAAGNWTGPYPFWFEDRPRRPPCTLKPRSTLPLYS